MEPRPDPPEPDDSADAPREPTAKELARENALLKRQIRQLERRATRSETFMRQTKSLNLRTQAELAEARDRAEQAASAKGSFLATMSHELRTPMNGILGALQLLRSTPLDHSQLGLTDIVHRSAEALLELLNDILDFSKIEAQRLELERVAFCPRLLLGDLVNLQRLAAQDKGVDLLLEADEDLPATVFGDPVRLRQVLLNLVSNAVKFTAEGSIVLRAGGAGPGRAWFEVADSGIGMSTEVAERIFDSFTQGDQGTTRRYGGTGLGLAITKRLVELMDGQVGVRSEPGVGSTFRFEIELPATADSPRRSRTRSRRAREEPSRRFGHHCLVVDDNPINRLVAGRLLQQLGCTVEEAGNGAEALEILEQERFDVVFMDGSMPVMDGFEATEALRASEEPLRSICIVALTAHAMAGDRERFLAAGMDEYLVKPVRLEALGRLLESVPAAGRPAA